MHVYITSCFAVSLRTALDSLYRESVGTNEIDYWTT